MQLENWWHKETPVSQANWEPHHLVQKGREFLEKEQEAGSGHQSCWSSPNRDTGHFGQGNYLCVELSHSLQDTKHCWPLPTKQL